MTYTIIQLFITEPGAHCIVDKVHMRNCLIPMLEITWHSSVPLSTKIHIIFSSQDWHIVPIGVHGKRRRKTILSIPKSSTKRGVSGRITAHPAIVPGNKAFGPPIDHSTRRSVDWNTLTVSFGARRRIGPLRTKLVFGGSQTDRLFHSFDRLTGNPSSLLSNRLSAAELASTAIAWRKVGLLRAVVAVVWSLSYKRVDIVPQG